MTFEKKVDQQVTDFKYSRPEAEEIAAIALGLSSGDCIAVTDEEANVIREAAAKAELVEDFEREQSFSRREAEMAAAIELEESDGDVIKVHGTDPVALERSQLREEPNFSDEELADADCDDP